MGESLTLLPDHPRNITNRLESTGIPKDLTSEIAQSYNNDMVNCISNFHRTAIPNVAHDW